MAFKKASPEAVAARALEKEQKKLLSKRKKRPKPSGPHTMKRQVPKKMGPYTQDEKAAVEALVASVTPEETDAMLLQRGRALAIALRRDTGSMADQVTKAQARLVARAEGYADKHWEATQIAAKAGDAKPAQWALEHITAKDEKGKKLRIVEPAKTEDTGNRGPTVNIMIPLGGVQQGATLAPGAPRVMATVIDVEREDAE